jgi:4-hydroxybenzoate polyprenyltransferase
MRLRGNWDLDRVPSKNERRIAIGLASFIFIFSALVLFSGVMLSLEGKVKLSGYWFYLIILIASCWVLVRAIFGKASKHQSIKASKHQSREPIPY